MPVAVSLQYPTLWQIPQALVSEKTEMPSHSVHGTQFAMWQPCASPDSYQVLNKGPKATGDPQIKCIRRNGLQCFFHRITIHSHKRFCEILIFAQRFFFNMRLFPRICSVSPVWCYLVFMAPSLCFQRYMLEMDLNGLQASAIFSSSSLSGKISIP